MNWWLGRRSRGKYDVAVYFEAANKLEADQLAGFCFKLKTGYYVLPVNPPPAKLALYRQMGPHKFYWEVPKI